MNNVLQVFIVIFDNMVDVMNNTCLGPFTWWQWFVSIWLLGILFFAIGFVFKNQGK